MKQTVFEYDGHKFQHVEKHNDRDNHDFDNYRDGFVDGLTFTYDAFKAGAKWQKNQGITKEAVIGMATEEISINVSQPTLEMLDLCAGDKVIIQIRKKED